MKAAIQGDLSAQTLSLRDMGWINLEFWFFVVCQILFMLKGIWLRWVCNSATCLSIQINPTQVLGQMKHPVLKLPAAQYLKTFQVIRDFSMKEPQQKCLTPWPIYDWWISLSSNSTSYRRVLWGGGAKVRGLLLEAVQDRLQGEDVRRHQQELQEGPHQGLQRRVETTIRRQQLERYDIDWNDGKSWHDLQS